jgi:hypothetical protein
MNDAVPHLALSSKYEHTAQSSALVLGCGSMACPTIPTINMILMVDTVWLAPSDLQQQEAMLHAVSA